MCSRSGRPCGSRVSTPSHVATLAELDGAWPPIVVRREDRSVVDGQHRVAAARRLGMATLQVSWFDGSAEDAFVEFVRCNVGHGLPLGLAERRSAASRILRITPRAFRPERCVGVRRLPEDRRPSPWRGRPQRAAARFRAGVSVATDAFARSTPPNCGAASPRSSNVGRRRPCARSRRRSGRRPRPCGASGASCVQPKADRPSPSRSVDTEATVLGLLTRRARTTHRLEGDQAFTTREGGCEFIEWFDSTAVDPRRPVGPRRECAAEPHLRGGRRSPPPGHVSGVTSPTRSKVRSVAA